MGANQREFILNYQMINTDVALHTLCDAMYHSPAIALDTEFVRTRTYYPQLGLIQIYDGEQPALIDPLSITDWMPFTTLLTHPSLIKFLHAAREDLDVFFSRFGVMPEPMIDTQILASFIGQPLSCGFATLVETWTGVQLDKSESRTDWLARPLTEKQCDYAAADVWYLLPVAQKLMEKTSQAGWLSAALDECQLMIQRRCDILSPEEAWRDIGNTWQLRPRQLACLQRLAAWRLCEARERDMAVNFVVREEHLWKVARYMPSSLGELNGMDLFGNEIRVHGQTLLGIVKEAEALPESVLPPPLVNLIDMPGYRTIFKAIKAQVETVGEAKGISAELLASRRQINQLLNWHWKLKPPTQRPELISGWRGELLNEPLNALLHDVTVG